MGLLLHLTILSFLLSTPRAEAKRTSVAAVGVNYGQLGNNLPSPPHAVQLIKHRLNSNSVKLYDADPNILGALKNTGFTACAMVPNELISSISSNRTLSDQWVGSNIVPFYPETRIRHLLVGNEVLSNPDIKPYWPNIVPAMKNIQASLRKHGIRKVKVGTSLAIDVLQSSAVYPPSNATFRPDISGRVIKPMLQFLSETQSWVYFDAYPYFHWAKDPKKINIDYALSASEDIEYTDPGTGLVYRNLFDQMVDSMIFAMKKLGYPDLRILIAETGWPSGGDYDQIGANIYNAATYNRNVVKKLTAKPPVGTPVRPGAAMPGFIFALFNENQKGGPSTERHFGLLYPNGSQVYELDLSGRTPESNFKPLPAPTNDGPYKGKIWCVVAPGVSNRTALGLGLSDACSHGDKTCDEIRPGKACNSPDLARRASYAFSSYWAKFRKSGVSCFFNGLAAQTIKDPSYGSCKFPSVTVSL